MAGRRTLLPLLPVGIRRWISNYSHSAVEPGALSSPRRCLHKVQVHKAVFCSYTVLAQATQCSVYFWLLFLQRRRVRLKRLQNFVVCSRQNRKRERTNKRKQRQAKEAAIVASTSPPETRRQRATLAFRMSRHRSASLPQKPPSRLLCHERRHSHFSRRNRPV